MRSPLKLSVAGTLSMEDPIQKIIVRLIRRLFNADKPFDYLALLVLALLPIRYAYLIGALFTVTDSNATYRGYLTSYNWTSFIVTLPLTLRSQALRRQFFLADGRQQGASAVLIFVCRLSHHPVPALVSREECPRVYWFLSF